MSFSSLLWNFSEFQSQRRAEGSHGLQRKEGSGWGVRCGAKLGALVLKTPDRFQKVPFDWRNESKARVIPILNDYFYGIMMDYAFHNWGFKYLW